jgi:hypothetical protein
MTAAKVIEEMDDLPPDEQVKVIQHAFDLAEHRQLSGEELGRLAQQMVDSNDPREVERLKSEIMRGFYGE